MGDRLLASIAFPGGFILRYSKLGKSMLSFFLFQPARISEQVPFFYCRSYRMAMMVASFSFVHV